MLNESSGRARAIVVYICHLFSRLYHESNSSYHMLSWYKDIQLYEETTHLERESQYSAANPVTTKSIDNQWFQRLIQILDIRRPTDRNKKTTALVPLTSTGLASTRWLRQRIGRIGVDHSLPGGNLVAALPVVSKAFVGRT